MVQVQSELHLWAVASDAGGNSRGAQQAPQVLRALGLVQRLQSLGLLATDCGNVPLPGMGLYPGHDDAGADAVAALAEQVHGCVLGSLQQGARPVLVGGDHSVVLGGIHAVAAHCRAQGRPLHVVWMDAHADFNTPISSPSGNAHGMPLASLCGFGPQPWVHLCQYPQALQGAQVSLIGVRDIDPEEKQLLDAAGVAVFDMQCLQRKGIPTVMEQVLASIPQGAHVHLSFDMDVMDPSLAPGVDTAVAGGLSFSMAQQALAMLAQFSNAPGQLGLGSMDCVELNPLRDRHHKTARLAMQLLVCALGHGQADSKPRLQGVA